MTRINLFFSTLLFALLSVGAVNAQFGPVPEDQIAFKAGEHLTYSVSYKVGFVNTDIATVSLRVKNSSVNNVSCYGITAVGEVDNFYKWFFDMRDVYETWLDKKTLRPVYFKNNLKEGSYRFTSNYTYDWDKMKVLSQYRNLKRENTDEKVMNLTPRSMDGIALFYNLRNTDLEAIQDGFKDYIEIILSDKIKRLQYRFMGREERNIAGLGRFKTLKFACQLTSGDDSFSDGSEFYVWFSDDDNKIPLYLESPIRVGSVKARLVKHQQLRHPLSSKID